MEDDHQRNILKVKNMLELQQYNFCTYSWHFYDTILIM